MCVCNANVAVETKFNAEWHFITWHIDYSSQMLTRETNLENLNVSNDRVEQYFLSLLTKPKWCICDVKKAETLTKKKKENKKNPF
jgi:hypothetical protein